MGRVTGIGGVFFKAEDPDALYAWYEKHLGMKQGVPGQGVNFVWKEDGDPEGMTVWCIFSKKTNYFEPSKQEFMLNLRVEDLEGLLVKLEEGGVWIDPKRMVEEYGRFAWIMDPEGNRIELWEPPKGSKE